MTPVSTSLSTKRNSKEISDVIENLHYQDSFSINFSKQRHAKSVGCPRRSILPKSPVAKNPAVPSPVADVQYDKVAHWPEYMVAVLVVESVT